MESDSDVELAAKTSNNNSVPLCFIPETSKKLYDKTYAVFMDWKKTQRVKSLSENVLMSYFSELKKKFKSSTLWTKYSMLRTTLCINDNTDIGKYDKLKAFLKRHSEEYKRPKPKIFTSSDIDKFIDEAPDELYLATKVVLIMGVMGACTRRELHQMKVTNFNDLGTAVLVTIPDSKTKLIRNFTISGRCYQVFKKYLSLRPPNVYEPWFFVNYHKGVCSIQKIGLNKLGTMGKEVARYLKLPNPELYTGHCLRRSSATILIDSAGDVTTLKRKRLLNSTTGRVEYSGESIKAKLGVGNKIPDTIGGVTNPSSTSEVQICSPTKTDY